MILITHIDLDGVGCEIVARWFYKDLTGERIYNCDYDAIDSLVCNLLENTTEFLLITDVSVNEKTAKYIDDHYQGRVEIFDHHKTAQSYLKKYKWANIDLSRSATKLFFETMRDRKPEIHVPDSLERLVFHANDYDLWIHESPLSKNFNDMVVLLGLDLFCDTILSRIAQNEPLIQKSDKLYLQGMENNKQKYFAQCIKRSVVIGNRLVIVASRYTSELGQYVRDLPPREEWKDVEFIDMLNFELGTHALRSYNPDFDVSRVALSHEGGGHPKASGYPMVLEDKWMEKF